MHAVIFGTGKWAKLIKDKLPIESYMIGYDSEYKRDSIPSKFFNGIVFISSATKNHFNDFVLALRLNPIRILVEKGFNNYHETILSKYFSETTPIAFLNQYRYSSVFDHINKNSIKEIVFNLDIPENNIIEWRYHILSLHNFLMNDSLAIRNLYYGKNILSSNSIANISMGRPRNFSIDIISEENKYTINLSMTNTISYDSNSYFYKNEDCLQKQILDVVYNFDNSKIERIK